MSERYDVAVVGGGPAGVSAAIAAHEEGAAVVVIERDARLGGVLSQCIHDGFGVLEYRERLTGPEYKNRQLDTLAHSVTRLTGAYLHSLSHTEDGWQMWVMTDRGVHHVHSAAVVMATGCRERTDRQIFLHGDRPAGIFTAGQAQRLINIDGIMPGSNVVILGSGDIGLIMARRLLLEGARVIGVYEAQASPSGLARNVAQCLEDWQIPLFLSRTVSEVHGRERLRSVTVCDVNEDGQADPDSSEEVECDTLVLSVGLIPENDMLLDMGLRLDPATEGPRVTQDRLTAIPGLFVCGNALLVYDLVDYVSECGRIAGRAAARWAQSAPIAAGATRTDPQAGSVSLTAAGGIRQLVPQLLDPSAETPPVVFLRPSREMERARLVLERGGAEAGSVQLRYLRRGEMVRYPVPDSVWNEFREQPAAMSVRLEGAAGG